MITHLIVRGIEQWWGLLGTVTLNEGRLDDPLLRGQQSVHISIPPTRFAQLAKTEYSVQAEVCRFLADSYSFSLNLSPLEYCPLETYISLFDTPYYYSTSRLLVTIYLKYFTMAETSTTPAPAPPKKHMHLNFFENAGCGSHMATGQWKLVLFPSSIFP